MDESLPNKIDYMHVVLIETICMFLVIYWNLSSHGLYSIELNVRGV